MTPVYCDGCCKKCVVMPNPTTITGIFDNDEDVAPCLEYLGGLSVAVENISVSGVESSNLRIVTTRLLAVPPDRSMVIGLFELSCTIAGVLIAMCTSLMSAPPGVLRELGMLGSLSLGAVFGCMCGTLIGCVAASALSSVHRNVHKEKLSRNQVALAVQVPEQSPAKDNVRAIMQEFGAVVTVEGEASPKRRNLGPPPASPR